MSEIRRVWSILSVEFRTKFLLLMVLIVVLALVQAVGLGAILPVVSVIVKPDLLLENEWGRRLYDVFSPSDTAEFTIYLIIGYGVIYLLLQASFVLLIYFRNRFSSDLLLDLSHRALRGYLDKKYDFFLDQNSSVLLKNILTETQVFVSGIVLNLVNLATNFFIVLAIFIILVMVDFRVAIGALLAIAVFFSLSFKAVKRTLSNWSVMRNNLLSDMNKAAHQALLGIKEVKVHGCEDQMIDSFLAAARPNADLNCKYNVLSAANGHVASALFFGGMLGVLFYCKVSGIELEPYIPIVVVFGIGLSRLLPVGTQLLNAFMGIRYARKSIDNVVEALTMAESSSGNEIQSAGAGAAFPVFQDKIEVSGICYRYPKVKEYAISDVGFDIRFGEKVAFVGSSGAGKSTVVNVLLGLLEPERGEVAVDGTSIVENQKEWRKQIGYVPQQVFLSDSSFKCNIAFGVPENAIDLDKVWQAVRLARLDGLVASLPDGLESHVGERGVKLSGGEQQRVGIARALYNAPRILLMDEPTSALDPVTEKDIVSDLLGLGEDLTILIVTHRLSSVKFCDRLFCFEKGQLAGVGGYKALYETSAAFRKLHEAWDDE